MRFGGALADDQLIGDSAVRFPLRYQRGDLAFARGQHIDAARAISAERFGSGGRLANAGA